MNNFHRAQILLEASQHQCLAEIAEEEGRSISDMVREIIRDHLAERSRQDRNRVSLQAMQRLTQIRTELQAENGILQVDPLAELREEWEKNVERVWRAEP